MSQTAIAKFTYIFFCLREISDYFGVATRLYLVIDMSLLSEQSGNTCKLLCLQTEICHHSG